MGLPGFTRQTGAVTASIADGASLSGAVALGPYVLYKIQVGASIDGTVFTFQGSTDNGTTYADLYDGSGGEITVQMAASRTIDINPRYTKGCTHVKVRTGTAASPSNQSPILSLSLGLGLYDVE